MDEITLDEKTYVSSKRAAQITGYAKDYVGQLCREGRVEARLVGRNWYVLEASVREHRFGAAPVKAEVEAENTPWESPQYASEPISELPTLDSGAKSAGGAAFAAAESPIDPVQEMQNAWQDWFSHKNIAPVQGEEVILELQTGEIEAENERLEAERIAYEAISVNEMNREAKEEEVDDEEEEVVPIHRSYRVDMPAYVPPAPVTRPAEPPQPRYAPQEPIRAVAPRPFAASMQTSQAPQARILRERRVVKRRKPSVVLQALFLTLAGIAIAVAVIGSGEVDALLSQSRFQIAPIKFLGGENVIDK
ncbi:MAG: hypothetical protein P4M11_00780 [Candidatus Pacebacteria bacterium]|nr:hypothetical protein [Candidatus Paceibacterota bacterium]